MMMAITHAGSQEKAHSVSTRHSGTTAAHQTTRTNTTLPQGSNHVAAIPTLPLPLCLVLGNCQLICALRLQMTSSWPRLCLSSHWKSYTAPLRPFSCYQYCLELSVIQSPWFRHHSLSIQAYPLRGTAMQMSVHFLLIIETSSRPQYL